MALLEFLRLTLILTLCVAPGFAQTASYTDDNPSVSPDGKKIAFMSDRDGDIEIYVMNVDGSNPQRLTHSPGRDAHPEWSPDGQKIYFQSPRETKVPQVFVMNADGSEPKRLTNNAGFTGVPLTRLMLETTPNKITIRTRPKDASATLAMLIVKSLAIPPADSGMFLLHSDEFDGFQYEDPTLHPKRVLVDLFAPNLSLEFVFLLNHEGASPHVSQSDINRVVQTVHKERTSPAFANASLANPE